jgi:hypothetical protein
MMAGEEIKQAKMTGMYGSRAPGFVKGMRPHTS